MFIHGINVGYTEFRKNKSWANSGFYIFRGTNKSHEIFSWEKMLGYSAQKNRAKCGKLFSPQQGKKGGKYKTRDTEDKRDEI